MDIISTTNEPLKILIIDDEAIWHTLIGGITESLGHTWQSASNFEEAKMAIKEAEENKSPFSVVTIDLIWKVGEDRQPFDLGTEMILKHIKSEHPYLACVLISASPEVAYKLLDLRDEYDLDYYVSKGKLNQETFGKAIARAIERVRPLGNTDRRREVLEETLEKYKDICAIYARNLAIAEKKKAQKGLDVSVEIEHEIETYRSKLEEARKEVQKVEEEIEHLQSESDDIA